MANYFLCLMLLAAVAIDKCMTSSSTSTPQCTLEKFLTCGQPFVRAIYDDGVTEDLPQSSAAFNAKIIEILATRADGEAHLCGIFYNFFACMGHFGPACTLPSSFVELLGISQPDADNYSRSYNLYGVPCTQLVEGINPPRLECNLYTSGTFFWLRGSRQCRGFWACMGTNAFNEDQPKFQWVRAVCPQGENLHAQLPRCVRTNSRMRNCPVLP